VVELQKEVRELQKQVRELQKQVTYHGRLIDGLQQEVARNTRAITALGARWGLMAEEAFRNGMKGIVEEIFGGKVERWEWFDEAGEVYGHPSIVEIDMVIRDGRHVLVEVKSSVSSGEVLEFLRIASLYEKVTGVKPELAIVSPYVNTRAHKLSEKAGTKVYTTLG